jgi:hypothetical protein
MAMTIARTELLRLREAAAEYKIPEPELRDLVEQGRLELYEMDDESGRVWLVARDKVATIAAEKFIRRENFRHLMGVKISISDASFKYHFHTGTISKWTQQGHVKVLERTANQVYVDEADMAYARALADLKGTKRGSSLFK